MSSLISRIKDAWLVLTGKEVIYQEEPKSINRSRVSNFRVVKLTSRNNTIYLDPGEYPLRMINYSNPTEVIDTGMTSLADFISTPPGIYILNYQMNDLNIFGTFSPESRELKVTSNKSLYSIKVVIQMPEYKLVKG